MNIELLLMLLSFFLSVVLLALLFIISIQKGDSSREKVVSDINKIKEQIYSDD